MKLNFWLQVIILVFLVNFMSASVYAHEFKKDVLGESIAASDVEVPPVSAGPGIFLPDSPFYFLDSTFQNIKLVLISSPEKKAQMHALIAQERLAELRIMMAKNNMTGIKRALSELDLENDAAANELKNASLKGKDVRNLASNINGEMKRQREFLNYLSAQSSGALELQLKAAKEELKLAKVEVEDHLDEDELLSEVGESISEDIKEGIEEASESAEGLERSIDILSRLASEAAKKEQVKREEALKRVIEVKSDTLKKQEQRMLELEMKKREKVYALKREAVESAREMVEDARATAQKLEDAKKAEKEPPVL